VVNFSRPVLDQPRILSTVTRTYFSATSRLVVRRDVFQALHVVSGVRIWGSKIVGMVQQKRGALGLPYAWARRVSPVGEAPTGNHPKGVYGTDTNVPSLAVRRKKAVSGLTFGVGSRSRKLTSPYQRCDGKRPCMTCVNGKGDYECTYEPRQRSHHTNAGTLPISRQTASRHLSARTLPSKPAAIGFPFSESPTRPSLGTPRLARSNSSESTSSLPPPPPLASYERPLAPSSRVHGEIALGPSSDVSNVQDIHPTTESAPHPTVSSFTVLPSIHFRRIPWPLPVPLSLIPPERVQISSNAGGDLDMTLYVLFRFLNSHLVMGTKP